MNEEQWRSEYASLDSLETPQAVTSAPAAPKPKKNAISFWAWVVLSLFIIGTSVLVILWLNQKVKQSSSSKDSSGTKVQEVSTNELTESPGSINVDSADRVVINGQLQTNDGVVITPTNQPAVAVFGQLYVDQTTKQIRYYNGQTFVTIATLDSNLCAKNAGDCGFALQSDINDILSQIGSSGGGVSSLQGQTGSLTLQGTGGLAVSGSGGSINISLPQTLTTTASPQFAGLTVTGTVNASSITSSGQITFFANGQSYILPTTGGSGQTICTTGITCTAGGGQAVILGPNTAGTPTAQTHASPTIPSIFINNTGGANLLQLQNNGTDSFVVVQDGSITTRTTVKNTSTTAFLVQNAGGTANLLTADTTNMRVSIGSGGTATGQLYISGVVPTTYTGSVATGNIPWSVVTQGNYAYVINQTGNTFQIFDVSNPASPVSVGSVATGSSPLGMQVVGRYAYIVNQTSNTLQIVDVSNPASPVSVGTPVTTGSAPSSVYVQGRLAYVTNQTSATLQIFDVGNPAAPVSLSTVTIGTTPRQVIVKDRYAYVVNQGSNTLQIIDVSNPASPTTVGTPVATGTGPISLYLQGRYIYVANSGDDTLQIFNVSNPASPASVGTVATGDLPRYVIVQNRYAYVINFTSSTFQIIDVSNPASPASVGTVATGNAPRGLFVSGRYAYVANSTDNTLHTYDLGGEYAQSLEAGSVSAATLQISNSLIVGGQTTLQGGLAVNGGIQTVGDSSIRGRLLIQTSVDHTSALQVQNAAGNSIVNVSTKSLSNMLPTNSTFESETDYLPWIVDNGTAEIDQDSYETNGSFALLFTNDASGATNDALKYPATSFSPSIAAGTYTLSFYAREYDGNSTNVVSAGRYTGSTLTGCTVLGNSTTLSSQWRKYYCTMTFAGTENGIYIRTSGNSREWVVDKVILQEGALAPLNNGLVTLTAPIKQTLDSEEAILIQNSSGSSVFTFNSIDGTYLQQAIASDKTVFEIQGQSNSSIFSIYAGKSGAASDWKFTNDMISSSYKRHQIQAAIYTISEKQYIYLPGGRTGDFASSGVTTTQIGEVANGEVTWKTYDSSEDLPAVRSAAGVVAAKGYVYFVGGVDSSGNSVNTVYYTKIGTNGKIEKPYTGASAKWAATSSLSVVRSHFKLIAYKSYLYAIGGTSGSDTGGGGITSVERALINADGSLGAWSTVGQNALPVGTRDGATVVSSGGVVYLAGGSTSGGIVNTVYKATIDTSGNVGTWPATTSLPTVSGSDNGARIRGSMVIDNGNIYFYGGANSGPKAQVFFATPDGSGNISSWGISYLTVGGSGTPNGDQARSGHGMVATSDHHLIVIGGNKGGSNDYLYAYKVLTGTTSQVTNNANINGNLVVSGSGEFSSVNIQSSPLDGNSVSAFSVSNKEGLKVFNVDTQYSNVTLGANNSAELNWRGTTNAPGNTPIHGSAVVNGFIYSISGTSSTVKYAKLNTDGTTGTWSTATNGLPENKNFGMTVAANGYIYAIGGHNGTSTSTKVYFAKPSSSGDITSAWKETASLSTAVVASAVSIANGYLYVLGGGTGITSGIPSGTSNAVQIAKLNPDGSLGTFAVGNNTNLPTVRGVRSVVVNGYIYYLGGHDGAAATSAIWYASLNSSTGAVGTWNLSATTINNGQAVAYHSSFVVNGYIYVVGGNSGELGVGTELDKVFYASISGSGEINSWAQANETIFFDTTVSNHTSVIANGYVYVIGGYSADDAVMFASTARVSVGGSLDLVGLGSRTLSDAGGGGLLTAGNTTVIGTFDVRDAATFTQSVSIGTSLVAHGDVLFQNDANSSTALQVQNAGGVSAITVDTSGYSSNLITNGNIETDTTGWAALGSATLSQNITQRYMNKASLQVATTAAANDGAKFNLSLTSGQTYTVQFYVRASGAGFSTLSFGYKDDGGETNCKTGQTAVTAGWLSQNCTFTVAGAVTGTEYFYFKQSDATSRTFYVDALHLVQSSDIGVYQENKIKLESAISTPVAIQPSIDTNTALQVQNASGATIFDIDTYNKRVGVGLLNPTASFHVTSLGTGDDILLVDNGASTGAIAVFQDNGSSVFTVANNGLVTSKPSSGNDSTTFFRVQDAAGTTTLLTIDTTANKKISVKNLQVDGHIISGNISGSTTVAGNANCGTGCTTSISGNDTAGVITINTGTTAAAGIQATVTFANAYTSAPRIVVTPNTVPAASTFPLYHVTSGTTTFDLLAYTALTDSKTYTFSYHIIQ